MDSCRNASMLVSSRKKDFSHWEKHRQKYLSDCGTYNPCTKLFTAEEHPTNLLYISKAIQKDFIFNTNLLVLCTTKNVDASPRVGLQTPSPPDNLVTCSRWEGWLMPSNYFCVVAVRMVITQRTENASPSWIVWWGWKERVSGSFYLGVITEENNL